jgi:hypothetical protein
MLVRGQSQLRSLALLGTFGAGAVIFGSAAGMYHCPNFQARPLDSCTSLCTPGVVAVHSINSTVAFVYSSSFLESGNSYNEFVHLTTRFSLEKVSVVAQLSNELHRWPEGLHKAPVLMACHQNCCCFKSEQGVSGKNCDKTVQSIGRLRLCPLMAPDCGCKHTETGQCKTLSNYRPITYQYWTNCT